MTYIIQEPKLSPNYKVLYHKKIEVYEVTKAGEVGYHKYPQLQAFCIHTLSNKGSLQNKTSNKTFIYNKNYNVEGILFFDSIQEAIEAKIQLLLEVQEEYNKYLQEMRQRIFGNINPIAKLKDTNE